MKKIIILLFCACSVASFAQTANTKVITNLSSERFKALLGNDKTGVLLDLRTTEELNKGFIKGAYQIDYLAKGAEKQIENLDKNKTYFIYCESGGRSSECASLMEKQNFKRVYTLEKGFSEWKQKGFPIEKK